MSSEQPIKSMITDKHKKNKKHKKAPLLKTVNNACYASKYFLINCEIDFGSPIIVRISFSNN